MIIYIVIMLHNYEQYDNIWIHGGNYIITIPQNWKTLDLPIIDVFLETR
jgi:presenilin-like A22 family membrane protease